MKTQYEQHNQDFSNLAHEVAQKAIYPHVFPMKMHRHDWLRFESTTLAMGERQRIMDGEMAVDRIISVHGYEYMAPFQFSAQERFRRPSYLSRKVRDVTITSWNNASNQPSELFKIVSDLFVYGFFDEASRSFADWCVLNTAELKIKLLSGELAQGFGGKNRKGQEFISPTWEDLKRVGVMVLEMSDVTTAQIAA